MYRADKLKTGKKFYYVLITRRFKIENYQDAFMNMPAYFLNDYTVYTVRMHNTMKTEKAREKCINDYNKLFFFFSSYSTFIFLQHATFTLLHAA